MNQRLFCVGEGIYIWVINKVTTAKGLSEIAKTELKEEAPQ